VNKAASGCGDVFIAKVTDAEYEEHRWAIYAALPVLLTSDCIGTSER